MGVDVFAPNRRHLAGVKSRNLGAVNLPGPTIVRRGVSREAEEGVG